MERLTKRIGSRAATVGDMGNLKDLRSVIERLAAYEEALPLEKAQALGNALDEERLEIFEEIGVITIHFDKDDKLWVKTVTGTISSAEAEELFKNE